MTKGSWLWAHLTKNKKCSQNRVGCLVVRIKATEAGPTAIWLKMTSFECCGVRKLSEHNLLNLLRALASLAAFSISIPAMPGAARRGQRGSNGTWQGWWSFLIQGIRQAGQPSSWSIKRSDASDNGFNVYAVGPAEKERWPFSCLSIKYSVTSRVVKCRNIYSVGTLVNKSEPVPHIK